MGAAREAARVLAARRPHSQMRRVLARDTAEGGAALSHGAADEVELRRLVGGAVLNTGEREVDGCSRVRAAVGRMVRAGLELQAAGRDATADFERRVREETRRHAKVRRFAAKWREVAQYGGPRRAAALREAARARYGAEATLAAREARGCVTGWPALERWEALGVTCSEMWAQARQVRSISPACAMREWRWLAGLRRWRWRTAFSRLGAAGAQEEGASQAREAAAAAVHGGTSWAVVMGLEAEVVTVGGSLGPPLAAKIVAEVAAGRDSLDGRAVAARRRWRDGGGRRRLEWLRRWEVDEGREADSRGRWRVARVLSVRRPAHRQGRQLEVQLEWAGVDTASGEAWAVEWWPLSHCTADVRLEARQMELTVYPAPRTAEPPVGSRKSPRLEEEAGAGAAQVARAAAMQAAGDAVSAALAVVGTARAECEGEATVAPATADGGTTTAGARQETLAPAAAGVAGAGAEVSEGGGQGRAEEDPLEAMVAEAEGRKRGRQEMLARVEADTDKRMDNGVRINPALREMARRAAAAEAAAEAGPTCGAGHVLTWRSEGVAGLGCDGRCGRKIRRGAGWWSCAECDFDVCEECSEA